jgi:membrane fusion protein (multidrug efflux system)
MSTATEAAPVPVDSLPSAAQPVTRPRSRTLLIGLAAATALAALLALWVSRRGLETTDNAQIDGEVVAVPARVAGPVAKVLFTENQTVKAGDLLAQLDDAQAQARLAQAEANLAAAMASAEAAEADAQVTETNAVGNRSVAEAGYQTASAGAGVVQDQIKEAETAVRAAETSLQQATTDRERSQSLFQRGAISKAQYDQTETAYNLAATNLDAARARLATLRESASQAKSRIVEASAKVRQTSSVKALIQQSQARAKAARAQVATAQAARDLAALELSYTRILAPQDGVISKKTIAVGQMVSVGQSVGQLVTADRWITGNFKETQLAHMRPGQPAHLTLDAYPGVTLYGEVESFSGATGSRFTLLPPDNATGNFTKVVQRVPVRIRLRDVPSDIALRPGLSVELTVDTRG